MLGKSVFIAVGDVAVLTCDVSDTPAGTTISFQWKRATDMSPIPGANSRNFLVSTSANILDTGIYTCEVTISDEGNSPLVIPTMVSANFTLTVTSK